MSTTGRGWKEQSNVAPLSVMACGEARARPPVSLRRGRSAARRVRRTARDEADVHEGAAREWTSRRCPVSASVMPRR